MFGQFLYVICEAVKIQGLSLSFHVFSFPVDLAISYMFVFNLVLFPSSHLGQGELTNFVILIMTRLYLWVPECVLKLSCLSQF